MYVLIQGAIIYNIWIPKTKHIINNSCEQTRGGRWALQDVFLGRLQVLAGAGVQRRRPSAMADLLDGRILQEVRRVLRLHHRVVAADVMEHRKFVPRAVHRVEGSLVRTFSCTSPAIAVTGSGLAGENASLWSHASYSTNIVWVISLQSDLRLSSIECGSHRSRPPSCRRIPSWPRTRRGRPGTSSATSGHQRCGCRRRGCPGTPTRECGRRGNHGNATPHGIPRT